MKNTISLFDEVRKTVTDLTQKVGAPVDNLYGVIDTPDLGPAADNAQIWYLLSADAIVMPDLHGFVNQYTYDRTGYQELRGSAGSVIYSPALDDRKRAHMFFGMLQTSGTTEVPIKIDAPGYEIAVYIGTTRIKIGRESLAVNPNVAVGNHNIAILLFGGEGDVEVETLPSLSFGRTMPIPDPPLWAKLPVSQYLDTKLLVLVNILEWANDPYAGAWNVYRARAIEVDESPLPVAETGGLYSLTWENATISLNVGDTLHTKQWEAGTIVKVETGTVSNEPYTMVTLVPSDEAPEVRSDWTGKMLYKAGTYISKASIDFAGTDTLTWEDTEAEAGTIYFYKLTALNFIDRSTESDFSEEEPLLTGDETPPGEITIISAVLERNVLRVRFLAPPDLDYVGVRVYGPYEEAPAEFLEEESIRVEYGEPGKVDQVFFAMEEIGFYYITPFDAIGNERAPEDTYFYEFDDPEAIPPAQVTNLTAVLVPDPYGMDILPRILLTWEKPEDERYGSANISVQIDGGEWTTVGKSYEETYNYFGYWGATHVFKVQSVSKYNEEIQANFDEAPTATLYVDPTDSMFSQDFTTLEQYTENRPPNGYFVIYKDDDNNGIPEEVSITPIGTLSE